MKNMNPIQVVLNCLLTMLIGWMPSAPMAAEHDHDRHGHKDQAEHKEQKEHDTKDDHAEHGGHDGHGEHEEHQDHAGHADRDKHGKHDKHNAHDADGGEHEEHEHAGHEEETIKLDPEVMQELDMKVARAAAGHLTNLLTITGEVVLNSEGVAHVTPRVSGIVRNVYKSVGDKVSRGEALALFESSELSAAKSGYLAEAARLDLARKKFIREKKLWTSKVGAELEYLESKQELAEAEINLRSARQRLITIGFSQKEMEELANQPEDSFMRYRVRAPISGTIIRKHLTPGEVHREDDEVFVIADLTTVWIDLAVYQKDLPHVRVGQQVLIMAGPHMPKLRATISMISPIVDPGTRTTLARIVLPNPQGIWRPGMFVTAQITVEHKDTSIVVPKDAVQTIGEQAVVFVRADNGFKPQPVKRGRSDAESVEILSGLTLGQEYLARGAFDLKAHTITSGFEGHAGHGH